MECIVKNIFDYIGESIEMGKDKKRKHNNEQTQHDISINQNNDNDSPSSSNYIIPKSTIIVLSAIIGTCVTLVSGVAVFTLTQIYEFKGIITENSTEINSLSNQITNLEDKTTQIDQLLNGTAENDGICTRLAVIENKLDAFENKLNTFESKLNTVEGKLNTLENKLNIPTISASQDIIVSVEKVSMEPMLTNSPSSFITPETKVGVDTNGNVYIANDLINETILLTYIDENKEVYFLGQYDDTYKWNGFCVTNAYYFDGTFYGICESDFEHGKRLNYKSIIYQPEENDWLFSDRICGEEENTGITIRYSFNYDKIKNFTRTNAKIIDIMYVQKFIEDVDAVMTKYYSGNTSNSYFNDTSGKAYRVTYNEDNTVKNLYVGNFVNGYFNDDTGNAWEILYSQENQCYYYNKGSFKDGIYTGDSSYPVDIDEISNIISYYTFDCELNWKKN